MLAQGTKLSILCTTLTGQEITELTPSWGAPLNTLTIPDQTHHWAAAEAVCNNGSGRVTLGSRGQ